MTLEALFYKCSNARNQSFFSNIQFSAQAVYANAAAQGLAHPQAIEECCSECKEILDKFKAKMDNAELLKFLDYYMRQALLYGCMDLAEIIHKYAENVSTDFAGIELKQYEEQ